MLQMKEPFIAVLPQKILIRLKSSPAGNAWPTRADGMMELKISL
jgi:hypothetical protein